MKSPSTCFAPGDVRDTRGRASLRQVHPPTTKPFGAMVLIILGETLVLCYVVAT